ncbi:MAG TPA: hypothetical protein PKX92_10920 [Edaphocola sp.]|nr:hypothetical protein [Edaphocola sp.]
MRLLKNITLVLLILIGVVSLFMTLSIIFNRFGIREKEGHYVLFVVYANLICGLLYLLAAYSIWKEQRKGSSLLLLALIILLIAFLGLGWHINNGGIYEPKTIKAMSFRTVFTFLMLLSSKKLLKNGVPKRKQ